MTTETGSAQAGECISWCLRPLLFAVAYLAAITCFFMVPSRIGEASNPGPEESVRHRTNHRGGVHRSGGGGLRRGRGGGREGTRRDVTIATLNVCAIRQRMDEVLDEINADIVCIQESGLTLSNVDSVKHYMQKHGVTLTPGPMLDVASRTNTRTGAAFREGAGSAKGGVAIAHRLPVTSLLVQEKNKEDGGDEEGGEGEEWEAALRFLNGTARFQAATVGCGTSQLNVLNVYGHSGANSRHAEAAMNENLLEAVALVAAGLGDAPTIIVGDFNVELARSDTISYLLRRGWSDAATAFGVEEEATFFATEEDWELRRGSKIDHILINPAATPMLKSVTIGDKRRTGGHREILATFGEVLANSTGPTFRAPRRSALEEEDVLPKEQRLAATSEIITRCQEEMLALLRRDLVDDAWSRLISTADDAIAAVRKRPTTEDDQKVRDKEEEECKQRWPMAFKTRRTMAPISNSLGMASASDHQAQKRRNQIRRLEEAAVKAKICADTTTTAEIRAKKMEELDQLMDKVKESATDEDHLCAVYQEWEAGGKRGGVEALRKGTEARCENAERKRCQERYKKEKEQRTAGKGGAWRMMKGREVGKVAAVRLSDGTFTAEPRDMLHVATQYWSKILNRDERFNVADYKEEYKEELEKLRCEEVQLRPLQAEDFIAAARRMHKGASAGVDGLSIAELRWLPSPFWHCVAAFFNFIETEGKCWPSQLLKARLVLIPKQGEEEGAADDKGGGGGGGGGGGIARVDKMRPITVLHTIARLWSSAKFRLLKGWIGERLPRAIVSGRKGGETSAIIVDIALRMEEAMAGLEEDASVVTTDFSKFFDCIPWELIELIGRQMGLPTSLLLLYARL